MFSQNYVDLTYIMSTCMLDDVIEIYSFSYKWHSISPGPHPNVAWTESHRAATKILNSENSLACHIRLFANIT